MRESRAVWTTAYVNDLPDSAFLYIEPGGSKDSEGKTTPRSLRHFPYKDASGKVDLPHLRNALGRIPQSSLPASVKTSVIAKARHIASANGVGEGSSSSGSNSRPAGGIERRYFPLTGVQVETRSGGDPMIRGYAAVFDSLSRKLGFFKERIAQGAGARSMRNDDIVSLWNHNPDYPLGRTSNGRLKLQMDTRGLHMAVKPSDTTYARDLVTNIRDGTVLHQSFSFVNARDKWSHEDGMEVRTLLDFDILDVSPVSFAAYTATDVQVRSWVKEAGLDFEPLSAVMNRCFRGLELTPADEELLDEAVNRIPALRSWTGVQARPRPRVLSRPPQARRSDLQHYRRRLAARHGARQMGDPDDDPGSLAQAIDQTLDEALDEHSQGNDDQGWQLVTAAAATVDQLLEVLNIPDSDESASATG